MVASHAPSPGNVTQNPGMCSDWESNQRPFYSQAQSTEPHQPGLILIILRQLSFLGIGLKELSVRSTSLRSCKNTRLKLDWEKFPVPAEGPGSSAHQHHTCDCRIQSRAWLLSLGCRGQNSHSSCFLDQTWAFYQSGK